MRSVDITTKDFHIQVSYSLWSGKEIVTHDGEVVSDKRSLGVVTPHSYVVEEEGQKNEYAVTLGPEFGYVVHKNGTIVAEYHRPFMRYIVALGFLVICLAFLQGLLYVASLVGSSPFSATFWFVNDWSDLVIFLGAILLAWWLKWHLRKVAARFDS